MISLVNIYCLCCSHCTALQQNTLSKMLIRKYLLRYDQRLHLRWIQQTIMQLQPCISQFLPFVQYLWSLNTLSLDCSSVTVFLGRKKGFSSLRDFPGTNLYRVVKQFTKGLEQRRYKMDGGSCERTMHFVLEQRVKKPFLART